MTLGTTSILAGPFATMGMRNNRLAHTARELLTQMPHRLGHFGLAGLRIGPLFLQPIKPLVKARVEVVAQSLPLVACADLGERDTLC
jgi:hypothetical protein